VIDPVLFLAFLPAALALMLLPGPDMLFCLGQGLRGGPRRAWAAPAGVATGGMVHVALGGLGLGALVAAYPTAFGAIRWAGAAYLVWLAWKTWLTPMSAEVGGAAPHWSKAYRDGMLVNLSNPKVILFILALLPQFVNPALSVLPQFLAMGCVIAGGAFVVNGAAGVFAGRAARVLLTASRGETVLRRGTALLFGGLAARLAWDAAR
jgi:threonine/homoserine/homoserine lactone efflux protein